MKYQCEIRIDAPIDKVVELWKDENNYVHWQDGFQSIERLSGDKGNVGAKSKIVLEDERRIVLTETIVSSDLPNEFTALYEHEHMTNAQTTRFQRIDDDTTLYVTEVDYIKFNGIVVKIIAMLFPQKFREQSNKWMKQFKAFAESK